MKLAKKGDYCIRAMLDLALQGEGQLVLLKDIARRQLVSERFLEQVMTTLKNAGFVKSNRGARGGYLLARHPAEITLLDILRGAIGDICLVDCVRSPERCSRASTCATREVWDELGDVIHRVLGSITLEEVANRQRAKVCPAAFTYEI